jgi:hypothetical protein
LNNNLCIYSSLPSPQSIRFMDLVPGKYKDPLCYEFVVSCLGAVNFYEALSYAWGDTARSHHVLIRDHHQLQINANLDSALRRLRHPETYCRLWVDAICVYPDRHRTKCCRNLRCEPQFCEGVGFAHLACRIGSTNRSPFVILSHSLARLERMRSNNTLFKSRPHFLTLAPANSFTELSQAHTGSKSQVPAGLYCLLQYCNTLLCGIVQ